MSKSIPIPAQTGKHKYIPFRVRRLNVPREMVTNGDTVRFIVTRKDSVTPVISKATDNGITQDDDGWGQVTLTPTDLLRSNFNANYDYEYDLEIQEGDTGNQWPLAHGPFEIDLSPQ